MTDTRAVSEQINESIKSFLDVLFSEDEKPALSDGEDLKTALDDIVIHNPHIDFTPDVTTVIGNILMGVAFMTAIEDGILSESKNTMVLYSGTERLLKGCSPLES